MLCSQLYSAREAAGSPASKPFDACIEACAGRMQQRLRCGRLDGTVGKLRRWRVGVLENQRGKEREREGGRERERKSASVSLSE